MFGDIYRNKRVFITGHTGFKGSWLTAWLLKLGAQVAGYSVGIPTSPSMFAATALHRNIEHHLGDVRDLEALSTAVTAYRPDVLFHLAAQPIVSESYRDPIGTISTNVIGTMNVLETLRVSGAPCVAVLITSDKCYENVEWPWGYRENDRLGGSDIYSGSKSAAELVIRAYQESFFRHAYKLRIASARAGNVIGGGDWAKDRIVVDCMRRWAQSLPVEIRSPKATRPWQHVLEPLSGYLHLATRLMLDDKLGGESFNFGPPAQQNHTVQHLIETLARHWGFREGEEFHTISGNPTFHETHLLKLNCDKASAMLRWQATLDYEQCVAMVAKWYRAYYGGTVDMSAVTLDQIEVFEACAVGKGLIWTN